jgi:hypothetical protein
MRQAAETAINFVKDGWLGAAGLVAKYPDFALIAWAVSLYIIARWL